MRNHFSISRRIYSRSIFLFFMALVISACSSSDGNDDKNDKVISYSYSTTSNKGDYSEWTISGDTLNATWSVINGDGDISYTYEITATCGSADEFGVKNCTISAGSCSDGIDICADSPSGSFDMMDVPGVALFVHTGSGGDSQLHVGFAKDAGACSQDGTGDYTFIRTGLGLNENFGIYRSDSNFIDILHADFGFDSSDENATQTVAYRTGTEAETLTDDGCANGVRTRSISGGGTIRSMLSSSGLFVMDFPSGSGGAVSFKTTLAATLSDFENKSFGGIVFPDNSGPEPVKAEFSTLSGGEIVITSTVGIQPEDTDNTIMALDTTADVLNPEYPDFTSQPPGYAVAALAIDYPNPAAIPGLFKIDHVNDDGRVVLAAMKYKNKVIAVGMVYNYRYTSDINPATGNNFDADGLYNTGNFLLFEK